MKKAWQQGRFDGFCGAYSLINSVNYLFHDFSEDDCSKLFHHIVRSYPEWFGAAILDGFGYKQVWQIAQTVQTYLGDRHPIRLSRPFYNQPLTKDSFLDRVGKLVGPASVAIIGLGSPWDHWSVATQITPRSIRFQDSYGIRRWNRTAVELEKSDHTTKVDCHQTILVSRPTSD